MWRLLTCYLRSTTTTLISRANGAKICSEDAHTLYICSSTTNKWGFSRKGPFFVCQSGEIKDWRLLWTMFLVYAKKTNSNSGWDCIRFMQIRWDKESAFLEKHCYLYGSLKKLCACTLQLLITMCVMMIHSQRVHSCYSFHRGVYGNANYLGRHRASKGRCFFSTLEKSDFLRLTTQAHT